MMTDNKMDKPRMEWAFLVYLWHDDNRYLISDWDVYFCEIIEQKYAIFKGWA